MIVNLIGQPCSGKTTVAKELSKYLTVRGIGAPINIDGDELRELFDNKDYSETGRRVNIKRAYDIALFLEKKLSFSIPIISLISPYKDLRDELRNKTNVVEVMLYTTEIRGREQYFAKDFQNQEVGDGISIDTTGKSVKEVVDEILLKMI